MDDDGALPPVRLLPPAPPEPLPDPDASGQEVLGRAGAGADLVVLGAPGTGKTCLALHLLLDTARRGRDALLLAPTRARANALRARAARLARPGPADGAVRVRTPAGYAFTVLTAFLTRRPDPLPAPVLLAGAEEDAALAALIRPEQWPGLPPEAVASRAFRTELRNLLARAGELGVGAGALAALGRELDVPLWGPASALLRTWDAQGRPTAGRRGEIRRMDTARVQDRAVEALEAWEAQGVIGARPVPDLVVVDDYQDCTAATARLLAALARPDAAGRRAQVVVLGDPDLAVETFRGGSPSLLVEAEDRSGLAAERLILRTAHRGTPALRAVWRDQAGRIPVTGTASHRLAPGAPAGPEGGADPGDARPGGVEVLVASGPAQEVAHVARALRGEHVHHATAWDAMAVIVRSAGRARAVARELRRRGVPPATTTPAVLLRAESAAGAVLAAARSALEGRLGEAGEAPERSSALDLLTGPLVGLSALDLRRLRRRLRRDRPAESGPDENLLAALASPEAAEALAGELADEPLAGQAARLVGAARIVDAARRVCQGRAGRAPARVDAEALLWAVWDASGCAGRWRAAALGVGADAEPLLAEAAERDLDVVTALFKRAEVWAERHPGAGAGAFLAELDAEALPSDSVAPHGSRPGGVAVLTPASAVGSQWEVVAVMGVERDAWPDLRLRDTMTRSGLLVEAVLDRLGLDAAGRPRPGADPVSARAQVRADERRMLLAALTRATRRLLVTAVADEDTAPSSFFIQIARAAGADVVDADGAPLVAPDVDDLTLRGLVGRLRRAAIDGDLPSAGPVERERARRAARLLAVLADAGAPGADPAAWAGWQGPTSTAPLVAAGRRVRVSPSDVEALVLCPLRWFLTRVGGDGAASGARVLGELVHSLAQEAQRRDLRGAGLMARFEQRLPELAYPDTWLGSVRAGRARAMVERLDAYLGQAPPVARVELPVRAALNLPDPDGAGRDLPVLITGRIDRLEHLDAPDPAGPAEPDADPAGPDVGPGSGRVRLIDFKTGRRTPDDPAHHPQLAVYRLALQALGYEVDGAALVLLGREPPKKNRGVPVMAPAGAALAPSPDPDTGQDWARDLLREAALAASGPVLTARAGEQCRTCPVKDSCPIRPEGRRVVA
ncbi:DNA helicase UvrD [Actinomyces sp. oral taxon 414]|uniref:PD-(D/E)XK nuclease family protein n=1 Tax=Actinomyces sp. oral taxon 414 TaxID=712122 RepID=UPI0006AF6BCC|nr:PD-(D/E)XK nuclease family protein [Actinomyces sp. oral taxon 414]ALC98712.1 DNA helicase UvrD [Actinomyces sp. oral taxon 414]